MEYSGNSYKSKGQESPAQQRQKLKKIVKGNVVAKNPERSFFREFFMKDVKELKDYLIFDVLLPKTKDMLFDLVDNGASMLIFGDGRKRSNGRPAGTYVSYSNYSSGSRSNAPTAAVRRSDAVCQDIIFDSPADAEEVLNSLIDYLDTYGNVSVGDLYDAVGYSPIQQTDWKYGWKNLSTAKTARVREGYIIQLPKPVSLD